MKNWVKDALAHAKLKQAALARKLHEEYRGWPDNRSVLNKIISGGRELHADEMFDISLATGFPVPKRGAQEGWKAILKYAVETARQQGASIDDLHLEFEIMAPVDVRHKLRLLAESDLPGMQTLVGLVERDVARSDKRDGEDKEGSRQ